MTLNKLKGDYHEKGKWNIENDEHCSSFGREGNEHRLQQEENKPSEEKEVIIEELLGPKIAYGRNLKYSSLGVFKQYFLVLQYSCTR